MTAHLERFDALGDGVAVVRNRRILYLNPALAALFGCAREHAVGHDLAAFVHPDDREALGEREAALDAGAMEFTQVFVRAGAGPETRTLRDAASACEVNGEPGSIHLFVDVTEHAQALRALRDGERHVRDLAEQLPMPMLELDGEGAITFANRQALHAFGLAQADLAGGLWLVELIEGTSRERALSALRRCLEGGPATPDRAGGSGASGGEEYLAVRRDGAPFPVVCYLHRIERGGGGAAPAGVRAVLLDITERKRMEAALREVNDELEARVRERTRELQATNARLLAEIDERGRVERSLRESEQRYRSLFECARDIVFSVDPDGTLRSLNPAFERLTGLQVAGWVGRPFSALVHEDDAAPAMELLQACLRGEAVEPREIRLLPGADEDGALRVVELSAAPIRADGVVLGVLGVARDVTERNRSSETLIRAERLAAVGTLAAGVAHEFNNLNAAILGFTNLALERSDLDPTLRDWLGRIRKNAQRSNVVAQRLLAFCAPPAPPRAIGNLALIVRETLALAAQQVEDIGAEVKLDLAPVPDIRLDPAGIGQALLQLVINAVHAMHGRPTRCLSVSTGREGQRLFVRVSDTGCGITPENLSRLFTPFFTTKGAHAGSHPHAAMSGTGLGLCICHTVVESHGGEITVSTVVNEGTAFTIWLPLKRPNEGMETKRTAT